MNDDTSWNVYLQWKGTTVCFDWWCPTPGCEGGDHIDYDMPFPGAFECPDCKTMWEMGTEVTLTALPADYEYADSGVLRQVEPPEDDSDIGVWKSNFEVDFETRQAEYRRQLENRPASP